MLIWGELEGGDGIGRVGGQEHAGLGRGLGLRMPHLLSGFDVKDELYLDEGQA